MKGVLQRVVLILIIFQGPIFIVCTLLYGFSVKILSIKDSDKRNSGLRKDYLTNTTIKEATMSDGECKGMKFVSNLINENAWLPVDVDRTMYVFSAFYNKARAKVYIVGAKQVRTISAVCQFWYNDVKTGEMRVTEQQAVVSMCKEGHGKKFTSTIVECPLASPDMPSHISLSTNTGKTPINMLQVRNASKPDKYKHKFTVCLSPLYLKYGRAYELVEWIELNRILGAEKFIVYYHSTAVNVDKVLEYYSKRGLVEVVQWRLPMAVSTKQPTEIHYNGQTAALHDCLFRSKAESEYIVHIDLDEFIVRHNKSLHNWTDIIKQVGRNKDVFLFRSTYFRKEWENDIGDFPARDWVEKFKLMTLQIFEHEGRIFRPKQRSKYIARTATVDRVMIHEVPNTRLTLVPVEIGLVHHYRNWNNQKDRHDQVRDETVQKKFGNYLIKHVHNVWKDLTEVKLDIPWQ